MNRIKTEVNKIDIKINHQWFLLRSKVIWWIVWHLPKNIYLLTVVRGFSEATSGKYGNRHILEVNYKDVYDAIVEKYKINDMTL